MHRNKKNLRIDLKRARKRKKIKERNEKSKH